MRSQDKETLLKVEKIKKYDEYSRKIEKQNYMPRNATSYDDMQQVTAYVDDKYLRTIIVANDVEVAKYKTKERALEVLDEIQNILRPKYILDSSSIKECGNSWVENGVIMQEYNANATIKELSTYVYEMPEE